MRNALLYLFLFLSSFFYSQSCAHTIKLTDTFGDGWNGGYVSVSVNGVTVLTNITLASGFGPLNYNFTASSGSTIRVFRTIAGSYPSEMRVQIVNNLGTVLLNTIQPVNGTSTSGGQTCIGSCGVATPGCTNTSSYGSAVAPNTPTTVTISSCNFQSEYSTVSGVVAGQTYQFGYSLGGYITVHTGTYNGPIVAYGNAPLNWASSYTGTVYVHYNTNSSCGTASSCGTSTVSCITCSAPSAPANDLVCNAYSISCSQLLSATTVNATNGGTGENGTCSVTQTMPGVWFQVAGTGQVMTAYLCNTVWDSKISVFSGPNCSSLTCVGGNDDNGPSCATTSASYQWTSVPGLNYYILVHGYSTNSAFQIGLICSSPPPADPTSVSASSWSICNGKSTTLTANGASGTVYWYSGGCGTAQIGTGNSITVSPSSSTTYYARNYNGSQFSNNCASATVTVNYPPTLTTSASNNTICLGSSTQLNVSTQASGSLTTTFVGGNGCTGGNMFDLVTSGNQVTVTGFTLNPTTTSTQSVNVYYRNGSYLGNETNPGVWTLLGTYTLNGVAATPTYMAVGSLVIPPGSTYGIYVQYDAIYTTANSSYSNGTLTLNAGVGLCSAFGGTNSPRTFNGIVHYVTVSNATYSWTPSASLNNSLISNPTATPTTTTTYTVIATSNGCSSSSSRTITVNPLPSVSAGPNQTICSGSGVSLNGSGATTYSWNNGVTNGVTFYPNGTQTYTVTGTNSNGCSNTASTTVTVVSAPMANAGQPETGVSTCGINQVQLAANTPQAGQTGTWMVFNGVGGSFSNVNSPTSTFTGNYGQSYTLQWTVTNGQCSTSYQKLVTFNQPNAASLGANIGSFDLLWGGLTSTDWATSTNWYEKQPAGHFVRMSGNAQPTNSSQVFTLNQANGGICIGNTNPTLTTSGNAYDVFVNPGITLNLTNDSLHIYHDIVNNGTLTASNGTVSFVGSQNSSFIGTGTSQLLNMKVNKTGGATVTLNHPVVVTGNLNMIQGNIFTTPTNLLTLGSSSSNSGTLTYNTGTIVGPFKRFFNNLPTNGLEGFFPVGTSTYNRYSNINFTSSPGVNQSLTVRYNTGAPIVNGSPLYNGLPLTISNSLIQNYSIDGYWEVIPNGGNYSSSINSTPYNITFFANNITGMTTPQICRIIKSPGSNHTSWQSCGTHVTIPQNANPQSFLISSNNTQGFSWFNIGTPNSQALPVELLSFDGTCNDNLITLNWKTATEHNSDYFEIQKSRDGINWSKLTTLNSVGNSNQITDYTTKDENAIDGNNYYKLIQYDIDGQFKEHGPINVVCNGNSKGYFSIFPNPSSGDFQVVLNNKQMIGDGTLIVRDSKGSEVFSLNVSIIKGINLFDVSNIKLLSGVYYVSVFSTENSTETLKLIIR
jgi:hypothetical protein